MHAEWRNLQICESSLLPVDGGKLSKSGITSAHNRPTDPIHTAVESRSVALLGSTAACDRGWPRPRWAMALWPAIAALMFITALSADAADVRLMLMAPISMISICQAMGDESSDCVSLPRCTGLAI